ncbi:hypothetical protein PIB30_080521 [Stylosanthes scabra]|uniref:Uncharacterized protein n=1 Tax=Stylosanthes scabra TaxID=79078 RepID=A0ABU6WUV2_9FABA|nr:hypothetical protein [Stylosanthes scabra]
MGSINVYPHRYRAAAHTGVTCKSRFVNCVAARLYHAAARLHGQHSNLKPPTFSQPCTSHNISIPRENDPNSILGILTGCKLCKTFSKSARISHRWKSTSAEVKKNQELQDSVDENATTS